MTCSCLSVFLRIVLLELPYDFFRNFEVGFLPSMGGGFLGLGLDSGGESHAVIGEVLRSVGKKVGFESFAGFKG